MGHFLERQTCSFLYVVTGPALAGVSGQSNNPAVVGQGVFATASFATFKMRKDVELWEICFTMLQKVPKAYNKVHTRQQVYNPRIEIPTGLKNKCFTVLPCWL